MKELLILDEPETKGYAYSSRGDMVRKLGGAWRPATRRERLMFEIRRPRLSLLGFALGLLVWVIVSRVLDAIS